MKNNKAAGPDNIPAEVIKADLDTSAEAFLPLITKIWNDELCPEDWKNGHNSLLAKKRTLDPMWKLQRDNASFST